MLCPCTSERGVHARLRRFRPQAQEAAIIVSARFNCELRAYQGHGDFTLVGLAEMLRCGRGRAP